MTTKNKIFAGSMLGAMIFVLLLTTVIGVYSILTHFFGSTFHFVPVIGVVAYLGLCYMQYCIYLNK